MDRRELRCLLGPHLFEVTPEPIFVVDPQGVFLDVNRAAARYLGADAEALVGRSLAAIFPPEQVQRQLEVIGRVVESGAPFVEEEVTPIGDHRYVFQYAVRRLEAPDGEVLGVLGMVHDVTGLVALERRYAELYERATDALFAVDPEGCLRALNREAEALSGYDRREVESVHYSELVHPEEVPRLQEFFQRRKAGGEAPTAYETRFLHASGEERWAEVHIAQESTAVGVFQASVRDVTARKQLEAMRRDFLHMVSHDVKAPLTVIQGFAAGLESGHYGQVSVQQRDCLQRIGGASRRIRRLMEQFLLAEQVDAAGGWSEKIGAVADAVEWAVDLFAGEAEARGVTVRVDGAGAGDARVRDEEGLRHILENLLGNAVKFTGRDGTVAVRVEREGGTARIEVRDTGVGVPAAELGRLFERFYRASTARGAEGSGLGLYIVKRLAERAGGRVAVESDADRGACFTVWIPVLEDG